MRKAVLILLFLVFFYPFKVQSAMMVPFLDTTINNITQGGDENFNFHVETYYQLQLQHNTDFVIQTAGGFGSHFISNDFAKDYQFFIIEDIPEGWQLSSVNCTSSGPSIIFNQISNGVWFVGNAFQAVSCDFHNERSDHRKTPVLIVPGVLGTNIKMDNELLWANMKMINPFNNDDFMDPLQFSQNLTPINNSTQFSDVIKKLDPLGSFKKFDYLDSLINLFTSSEAGYVEGEDLFTFPYDWRYGVSGRFEDGKGVVDQLKGQIDYILNQTDAGRATGKVNVVAHSTGGLLVKKYVAEHRADNNIDKAIMVGVPNLGAPKAFKALISGDNFGVVGLDDDEMKKIAQNLPVVYDLAPTREYANQVGGFLHVHNYLALDKSRKDYDASYDETLAELKNQHLINEQAMTNAQNLHSPEFENFDMRAGGVDVYNIVGCKRGTFGKFTETIDKHSLSFDFPKITNGDGTVPLASAQTVMASSSNVYFVPNSNHGQMPSENGIRQQIVNLITGSNLNTNGKVLARDVVQQNPSLCQIKGETIKIKSPVSIEAVDQDGNFAGLAEDGSVQNDIPGADYEIWGDHKYVFLPTDEGQAYSIYLTGTGEGTFTLMDETIDNEQVVKTQVFADLPVTTAMTGMMDLGSNAALYLDTDGNGETDREITVATILDNYQSEDIFAPTTTPVITGEPGESGFYRSDVGVDFIAEDEGEEQASGVMRVLYRVGEGDFLEYEATSTGSSTPVMITGEGGHVLDYYAVDRAGNREEVKSLNLTIDKTPPEATSSVEGDIIGSGRYAKGAKAIITAEDGISGLNNIKYTLDGWQTEDVYQAPLIFDTDGARQLEFYATDRAGNKSQVKTLSIKVGSLPPVVTSSGGGGGSSGGGTVVYGGGGNQKQNQGGQDKQEVSLLVGQPVLPESPEQEGKITLPGNAQTVLYSQNNFNDQKTPEVTTTTVGQEILGAITTQENILSDVQEENRGNEEPGFWGWLESLGFNLAWKAVVVASGFVLKIFMIFEG